MARCANPECPDAELTRLGLRHEWVQIHQVRLEQVGGNPGGGAVQHLFAAVTCSKRCAVAVLTAELPAEDAEREAARRIFGGFRSSSDG